MHWIALLARHFSQGAIITDFAAQLYDARTRQLPIVRRRQVLPRHRQCLCRTLQAQEQIYQYLRRIGADRLWIGLLGLAAKIVQSFLDVVTGQDRQVNTDSTIQVLEWRIARMDEAAGQVLAILA